MFNLVLFLFHLPPIAMHWKRGSGILKYGNRKVITQTNQDSLPNC